MKTATIRAAIAIIIFLTIRLAVVCYRGVSEAYWYTIYIPLGIFLFAILEIAWTQHRFEQLGPVITSLIQARNKQAVCRWYSKEVRRMYRVRSCVLTALVFLPLVVFGAWSVGWGAWHQDNMLKWFDIIGVVAMFTAASSSQWPFANISAFVVRLPKKNLVINFYSHPRDSILVVGSFMLQIVLGGITLTFLTGLMLFVSPCRVNSAAYFLLVAVFIWAVIWFFVTQYNVHECMVMKKCDKLAVISKKLTDSLELSLKEPSPKNVAELNAAKEVYDKVDALPEWPFNTQNVLTLLSSVIVPIVLAVLNLVFSK
jgi:hypothetical protein